MLIHYWLFNALTGGHGQKHYDVKNYDSWKRKITRENERERGSFTFNYSIAHCVGDGGERGREKEMEMKRRGESQAAALRLKLAQKTQTHKRAQTTITGRLCSLSDNCRYCHRIIQRSKLALQLLPFYRFILYIQQPVWHGHTYKVRHRIGKYVCSESD